MKINILDLIIITLSIMFVIRGYKLGLIKQLTAILAIVIGIYIAQEQYKIIGKLLFDKFELTLKVAEVISFILIILVVGLIINILAYFITKILDIVFLSFVDNFFGSLFGLLKGIIVIYIFLIIISNLPINILEKQVNMSYLADKIMGLDTTIKEIITELSQ